MTLLYIHALTVADAAGNRLLDRLSLDVDAGQVLGLSGGPGAGKSLLRDIVSGAMPAGLEIAGGRILFGNRDLAAEPRLMDDRNVPEPPIPIYEHPSAAPAGRDASDTGAIVIDRDPAALAYICDEIAVLCAGRLVERAPSRELINAPRHPYTRALLEGDGSDFGLGSGTDGCPFRPTCPQSEAACDQATMRLQMISADHATACTRWRALWPAAA